jgi:L-histidine N-alpha-methyltransferase
VPEPELRICADEDDLVAALRADVRHGLASRPKHLPMRLHYDGQGAALFGELTRQPEYYLTRCEREILTARAGEIARAVGENGPALMVELGAGTAEKIRSVLNALRAEDRLKSFWPFDVHEPTLRAVLDGLTEAYPDTVLGGIVGDFTLHLEHLPDTGGTRTVAFLGGTFGNFPGMERRQFLTDLREVLRSGEWFLVGVDLVKDPEVLLAAYTDAAGVTAAFNRNVLRVLDDRLDADFEPDRFEHVALWDAEASAVDIRLRATAPMKADVAALDLEVAFEAGEEIHTGISTKFHPGELEDQLKSLGFEVRHCWTDAKGYFATILAQAV